MKLQAMHYYTIGLGLIALLLVATLLVTLSSSSYRKSSAVPAPTAKGVQRATPEGNNTARAVVQIAPEPDINEAVQQVRIGN
ncbi:hypothetical protein HY623_02725 [Candidatus Uhrbacteria bacterium]|nr:hypothetical protein [Candidatus Uhrbacteria bacterium]